MRHIALLLMIGTTACRGFGAEVTQFKLENGLKVILSPVAGSSRTALVVLFDIGGDYDPAGQSGLAHLVEHVYVTAATRSAKARSIREYVAAYPHGWNAQTGDRYTVIATIFDADALERELNDAAERMRSLRVTDSDLEREKPRIGEELRNMYGGIPQIAVNNLARELVHPGSPGHRKGGVIEQVLKLGTSDVQEWWQRYYKPNRATLVLAGRFDPHEVKRRLESHFGSIEPGERLPGTGQVGKPSLGAPHEFRIKPIQRNARPRVSLAYAAPPPADPLFAAFLVLVARLQTQSAKLHTDAYSYPVQFMAIDDPSVLYVTCEVPARESAKDPMRRLDEFVENVTRRPIAAADLETARNMYGMVYGFADLLMPAFGNNVYGLAFSLGRCQQLGIEPKQLARDLGAVRQETVDQCRKTVFDSKRRAAAIVTVE
jgi:predicted Zn-dependent peptidase